MRPDSPEYSLPDHAQPGALPLRPLTTGELLDAAVALLRTRARFLLGAGFLAALAEQAVLFPLRRAADVDASYLPGDDRLGQFGVLIVVGFATEVMCIGLLAGIASAAAPRALLGAAAPRQGGSAVVAVVPVVTFAAIMVAGSAAAYLFFPVRYEVAGLMLAALVTFFVWPFAYGLFGLAVPAVVIDRLGPVRALLRSVRLSSRLAMRAAWIRVLGYIAWLLIRLALGLGGIALFEVFLDSPSTTVDNLLMGAAWLAVNALAYPMLGCLDAALHLETRMRTEGLDIALGRSLRRGVASETALAVPR
jgi:hypothetical protein